MHKYKTIKGEKEHRTEINRSIFICNLKGIHNFDLGMDFVKQISKKYSDATHNCYALLTIDNKQKFFDAGEPGGTAGQPILQTLKNHNLNNTVAIVTRYFGGIKLGSSGLINAYSNSVNETINLSDTAYMILCKKATISLDYNELPLLLRHTKCRVLDTQYADTVHLTLACPIKHIEQTESTISSITAGKTTIYWKEEGYYNLNNNYSN